MTKPWFKNYPENVVKQVNTQKYHSLLDLFHQTIAQYKDKIAFENFGTQLSFKQVEELSRNFAAYLQIKLQIKKGDRVALMCPNILCFPIAMWGIIRAGGIQVNVNPLYTARELQHQLNDAQANTIVIFASSTTVLADIKENTTIKNIIIIHLDDLVNKALPAAPIDERLKKISLFNDALTQGQSLPLSEAILSQTDLLYLQYTGGTTGLSKGAMLTHGNIIANLMQYQEFSKNLITYGEEIVITAIPMYHIFALTANCLAYFIFGGKNILVTNPRDMPAFVALWKQANATFFTGVNTLFNGLLNTPEFDEVDFSHLKLCIGGGAAIQQAVADKWQKITGVILNEGYGLSETSPILSLNFGTDKVYIPGIGVPLPSTDLSIRDDFNHILPQGERGELCAKGPQVMLGYWHNKEATKAVMTLDGYFKTGDIGCLDKYGFFHIVDRKKDMILVSGFNVYPNEIEAEIASMAGVLESACIGIPDEKTGEAVKLFVVKQESNITVEEIIEFLRKNLTAYKVPKHIQFIDEIPKSTVGKMLRRSLR